MYYSVLCLLGILFWKCSHEDDDNISSFDLTTMVLTLATVICCKLKRRGPGRGKFLGILCRPACVLTMLVVKLGKSWSTGREGPSAEIKLGDLFIFPLPRPPKLFFLLFLIPNHFCNLSFPRSDSVTQ